MRMPIQRAFAVGLWLCVTAAATAIVWAGTSSVAANLTDRPAPVVAHGDVVTELTSGAAAADTAPGITAPTTSVPPSAIPADDPGSTSNPNPQGAAPARTQPALPGGATTPSPGAPPAAPPVAPPVSPPTTLVPPRPTATYPTPGGVVTVACSGFFIDLVSATPANGYAANVVSRGPYYVEVHFVRAGSDEPLWAFCLGQPVRAYGGPPPPR